MRSVGIDLRLPLLRVSLYNGRRFECQVGATRGAGFIARVIADSAVETVYIEHGSFFRFIVVIAMSFPALCC